MPRSRRAYYWFIVFLIPCMLGIDQCGTRLFFTREGSKNSPTEPCVEYIATPTPGQLTPPGSSDPDPQNTPLIQDGEVVVVVTPELLPTPTISTQYTVTITDFSSCNVDPTGTVIKSSGDTIVFTISIPLTACFADMYVDGSFYTSFVLPPPPTVTYPFTVTGNHVIEFL